MRASKTGRVVAAIFLGMMFGLFKHFQQMRALELGRDGYLAEQSHYFDRITRLHSTFFTMIAGIIAAAVAIALYESIASAVTKAIPPSSVEE